MANVSLPEAPVMMIGAVPAWALITIWVVAPAASVPRTNCEMSPCCKLTGIEVETSCPLVKWFDTTKGFGFVASKDGGKDVFIHISVLGPAGISHLSEGQPVTMKVVDTPKGREAISLQLA